MPRPLLLLVALLVLLAGGAGAGTWIYYRTRPDPSVRLDQSLRNGDLRAVTFELRSLLRDRPNDPVTHLKAADIQLRVGDPIAAEKEAQTASQLGAPKSAVLPLLGRALAAQGKFKEVLAALPTTGDTPAATANYLLMRSAAQLGSKDLDAAAGTLATARAEVPDRAETALIDASLDFARNDVASGEKKLDLALQRDPNLFEALLMKANVLINRNDPAGAIPFADRAVAVQPWSVIARMARADLLIGAGQDQKAEADLDTIIQVQPRNGLAQYKKATLLVRAQRFNDAEPALAALESLSPVLPRIDFFRAIVAGRLNRLNPAQEFAARYNRRVPTDPEGNQLLARTELAIRRPDAALAALDRFGTGDGVPAVVWDLRGLAYGMMGRVKDASTSFDQAARIDPQNPDYAQHAGLYAAQSGSAGTDQALDRLAEVATRQAQAGETLVVAAMRAGELPRAREALERLKASVGDTETVGVLAGRVALAEGDLAGAERIFADVIRRFPDSASARILQARNLIAQGKLDAGATLLAQVLDANRGNLEALEPYVSVQTQREQFAPAIRAIEAARKARPDNLDLLAVQADVTRRGGDADAAIELLKPAMLVQTTPRMRLALADAQAAAGKLPEARATMDDLVRSQPGDPAPIRAKVQLLLRLNDTAAARATLLDAITRYPGDYGFMFALVGLAAQTGGLDAALRQADELRNDPSHMPLAAVLRGDAYNSARKFPEASQAYMDEYRKAHGAILLTRAAAALIDAKQPDAAATLLRDHVAELDGDMDVTRQLSALDLAAGRLAAARAGCEAMLRRDRNNVFALNNMAWIMLAQKDPAALATAQRAFILSPIPETADTYAWTLFTNGNDAERALPLLRLARKERPNDPTIAYHAAAVLDRLGMKDEAIAALQPVIAAKSEFDDRSAAEALLGRMRGG